ncbi:hypothetical protein RclHR1_00460030 [Rhizophagus clarus]|nr:hypothetical protein RclHR1_00460030 [Rhizophagus clarus]
MELRDRRLKVTREYRLKNLKKVADKNLALYKIAKKNTIQSTILSIACVVFGVIFIFLVKGSGVSKIVENSVAGVVSLLSFIGSIKSFITPSTDDDCIALKFSEVCPEYVDLSMKTTDEDDIRNTENTIERWCTYLQIMKSLYTIIIMFSSLLFIIFIILDFTLKETNVIPVNLAIIIFGAIALMGALINRYFLKRFTFTGDGGKDIERLINGINIHIKRNSARDLDQLISYYFHDKKSIETFWDVLLYVLKKVKKVIILFIRVLLKIMELLIKLLEISRLKKKKPDDNKLRTLIEELVAIKDADPKVAVASATINNHSNDITSWIWELFIVMENFGWKFQQNIDSKSESNMRKLMKKLSLKELVEIIQVSNNHRYQYELEAAKLTVDYSILRELQGAAKELLDVLNRGIKKINGSNKSSSKCDKLQTEFSKMSKMLEVINQKTENSIKSAKFDKIGKVLEMINRKTENSIDPTSEELELSVILVGMEDINKITEKVNKYSDPTPAQVDELYDNILEKLLELFNVSKNLKKITDPTLKLHGIEKELSKTSETLKEINQKIETPIEDMRYAKIVHNSSQRILDEIGDKLSELHRIKQDLIDKGKFDEKNDFNELPDKKVDENLFNIFIKMANESFRILEFLPNKVKKNLTTELDKLSEIRKIKEKTIEGTEDRSRRDSKDSDNHIEKILPEKLEEMGKGLSSILNNTIVTMRDEIKKKKEINKEPITEKFINEIQISDECFSTEFPTPDLLSKLSENLNNVEKKISKILNNAHATINVNLKTKKAKEFYETLKDSDALIQKMKIYKNNSAVLEPIKKLSKILEKVKKELNEYSKNYNNIKGLSKETEKELSKETEEELSNIRDFITTTVENIDPKTEKEKELIHHLKEKLSTTTIENIDDSKKNMKELSNIINTTIENIEEKEELSNIRNIITQTIKDIDPKTKKVKEFIDDLLKNINISAYIKKLSEEVEVKRNLSDIHITTTIEKINPKTEKAKEFISDFLKDSTPIKEKLFKKYNKEEEELSELPNKINIKIEQMNPKTKKAKEIIGEFLKDSKNFNYSVNPTPIKEKLIDLLGKVDEELTKTLKKINDFAPIKIEIFDKEEEEKLSEIFNETNKQINYSTDLVSIEKNLSDMINELKEKTSQKTENYKSLPTEERLGKLEKSQEVLKKLKELQEELKELKELQEELKELKVSEEGLNELKKLKEPEKLKKLEELEECKALHDGLNELNDELNELGELNDFYEKWLHFSKLNELDLYQDLMLKELKEIINLYITLGKLQNLKKEKRYQELNRRLEEFDEFTEFKELYELYKKINLEIYESTKKNYSTHLVKDKDFFPLLYENIHDAIVEVERQTKIEPKSCYIDYGKHFGNHLFRHLIRDAKKHGSYKEDNRKLIRCYYRLGELLFSDNDGVNALKKVTDLQHRKAKNIYDLYNKIPLAFNVFNDNILPIDMIGKIKTRYASIIFALSNEDVIYLIDAIEDRIAEQKGKKVKNKSENQNKLSRFFNCINKGEDESKSSQDESKKISATDHIDESEKNVMIRVDG